MKNKQHMSAMWARTFLTVCVLALSYSVLWGSGALWGIKRALGHFHVQYT
jgi:hypothetical protein